jgi:5-methyltetrahydrofolate--homocysteine methyltransferase
VVYVPNASRAVGVTASLLSDQQRPEFVARLQKEYDSARRQHAGKHKRTRLLSLDRARANAFDPGWSDYTPPVPCQLGVQVVEPDLDTLCGYIDWTPFFMTWQLKGKFPAILQDETVGEEATRIYNDAKNIIAGAITDGSLKARDVFGLFPANRFGDDILVYTDETRSEVLQTLHNLRQQGEKRNGQRNYSLADFIAPEGTPDYIGGFAVTAGIGEDDLARHYEEQHDDYHAIMVKAVADRLAEAFAEYLHEQVRKLHWGYAKDENLGKEDLIREKYQGIRPAPGYPACPEHTEKRTLWQLLDAEANTEMKLTENCAIWPGASVAGLYFSHPESRYFAIGQIGEDQKEDYQERKGWDNTEAEKWLAPNLSGTAA